jgi:hypothetical protein
MDVLLSLGSPGGNGKRLAAELRPLSRQAGKTAMHREWTAGERWVNN